MKTRISCSFCEEPNAFIFCAAKKRSKKARDGFATRYESPLIPLGYLRNSRRQMLLSGSNILDTPRVPIAVSSCVCRCHIAASRGWTNAGVFLFSNKTDHGLMARGPPHKSSTLYYKHIGYLTRMLCNEGLNLEKSIFINITT